MHDQLSQSRRRNLRFGKSAIHAWGIFTDELILADELVIEYKGELIRSIVCKRREKLYEEQRVGSDYMFRIDNDLVCDATRKGSLARFINRSTVSRTASHASSRTST